MADTVYSAQEFDVPFGSGFRWLRFWVYAALHSNKAKGYNKKFKIHPSQDKIDETKGFVVTGTKLVNQGESSVNLDWMVKVVKTNAGYHLTADNELAKEFLGLLHGLCPAEADQGIGARGYNLTARQQNYDFDVQGVEELINEFAGSNGYKLVDELDQKLKEGSGKLFEYKVKNDSKNISIIYYKKGTILTSGKDKETTNAFWTAFLDRFPEKEKK